MKREKRGAALLLIVAMVLTGIPSYAWASPIEQPVESSIIEETAEPSITEDSGYIEESEEQPVGQDQYDAHIYNEYDFVTALNGKCKNIKIEQDFELTKSYTIEEDMTIEMQGHNIRSNYRGTVPIHTDDIIRLTIAEGKKVQIISSVTYSTVLAGSKMVPIVNNGTLKINSVNILDTYGPAIRNNGILSTERAYLSANEVLDSDIPAAVINQKEYTMFRSSRVDGDCPIGLSNASGAKLIMYEGTITVSKHENSCGVSNNGLFKQCGGYITRTSYGEGIGVINTGTYTMQSGTIKDLSVGVLSCEDGVFEMTGSGAGIRCFDIAVATNASVDPVLASLVSSRKSGTFFMRNGSAGEAGKIIGNSTITQYPTFFVAYTDSIPQIYGGKVIASHAAVAHFSEGSYQALKGVYDNGRQKQIPAIYRDGDQIKEAKKITNGLISNLDGNDYVSMNKVRDFAELKNAIDQASEDSENPTYICLLNSINVDEDLSIPSKKQIVLCTMNDAGKLVISRNSEVTINAEAQVRVEVQIDVTVDTGSAILNKGTLVAADEMNVNTGVSNSSASVIDNQGQLTMEFQSDIGGGQTQSFEVYNAVYNTGHVEMKGEIYNFHKGIINKGSCTVGGIIQTSSGNCIDNEGQLTLEYGNFASNDGCVVKQSSGTVKVSGNATMVGKPYVFICENNTIPELGDSKLYGSRYAIAIADSTKPFMTWPSGKFTRSSAPAIEVDSNQASILIDGIPHYETRELYFTKKYIQMDPGEALTFVEDFLNNPDYADMIRMPEDGYLLSDNQTQSIDKISFTSSNEDVIQLVTVSGGDATYPHPSLSANRTVAIAKSSGYAVIKLTTAGGVEDYIRVDVTDGKTKKSDLSTKDFEGHLQQREYSLNAYKRKHSIVFGVNLIANRKDLYQIDSTADDIWKTSWRPNKIVINDSEFSEYYTVDNCYINDHERSEYCFDIRPKMDGGMPKVISENIKSIKNIDVYMTMSGNGVEADGMVKIGTMDIGIDDTKPKITCDPITLDAAFNANSRFNAKVIRDNLELHSPQIPDGDLSYSTIEYSPVNGIQIGNNGKINYFGTVRNRKLRMPVTLQIRNYYGTYTSAIPLIINGTKPKAKPVVSTYFVAKEWQKSDTIEIDLQSKYEPSISQLKSAQIVGDSNYAISMTSFGGSTTEGNHYVKEGAIRLSAKSDSKAETIKIKLTYNNTRNFGGKPYVSYIKIKVKTPKKYSLKAQKKVQTLDPTSYLNENNYYDREKATFTFTKTPSNYIGGTFIVTNLDGLELVEGPDPRTGEFSVRASKDMDTSKSRKILVKWMDDVTKEPLATTTVTVKFNAKQVLSMKTDQVTMHLDVPVKYYGDYAGNKYLYAYDSYLNTSSGDKDDICTEAVVDQMAQKLDLKEKGTLARTGSIYTLDSRFTVNLWKATQKGKIYWAPHIKPEEFALTTGSVKPGEDYIVNIVRTDKMGNSYEKSITIHMADIKAKTAFTESKVKLYKKTPYYEAPVDIKPISPCYGVITDVACNDPNYSFRLDSSSDVRFLTGSQMGWFGRNEYQTYYLLYTNHSSKNVKETKPVKVKVTFTYMSGITSTEELTIQNCDTQ